MEGTIRGVDLFTGIGNDDQGLLVRLDDEAGIDIDAAVNSGTNAPVAGTFNPAGAALMSIFDGEDASGQRGLTITDDTATNTGFLNGWSLALRILPPHRAFVLG
jgi:hypothetical protein